MWCFPYSWYTLSLSRKSSASPKFPLCEIWNDFLSLPLPWRIGVLEFWPGLNLLSLILIVVGYSRGIYKTDSDGKYEGGLFTEAQSKERLAVGISPMKAYVYGYESENLSTIYRTVKKGRDTNEVNNSSTSLLRTLTLIFASSENFFKK